jgi:hypothetical protein
VFEAKDTAQKYEKWVVRSTGLLRSYLGLKLYSVKMDTNKRAYKMLGYLNQAVE